MSKKGLVSVLIIVAMAIGLSLPVVAHAELTEAQKKALEATMKAEELAKEAAKQTPGATTPPTAKVVAASMNGRISAIGANSVTVGIIGNGTVNVTAGTAITFNGQPARVNAMHIGDQISVKYDAATRNAISIESEGFWWGAAVYTDVAKVIAVGLIGNSITALHYGMITSHGAGVNLNAAAQVTVNGVPATYLDIKVGDTIDYVQDSTDLNAIFVKVTR